MEVSAPGAKAGVADLGGGRCRWYVTQRVAAGAGKRSIDKAEILAHVDGWYELVPAVVQAADPSAIVTTEMWDLDPLDSWVNGRVVLLGDAAHATTPFASMGACMTVEDSVALVDQLGSRDRVEDALRAFQDERKRRDEAVVRKSRQMGKLSQMHSPIATWLRDEAFSHLPEDRLRQVVEEMAQGE